MEANGARVALYGTADVREPTGFALLAGRLARAALCITEGTRQARARSLLSCGSTRAALSARRRTVEGSECTGTARGAGTLSFTESDVTRWAQVAPNVREDS